MIIERDTQIQADVITALRAALPGVHVSADVSKPANGRYVRVDGFNLLDDDMYKNAETSTHFFFVHVFDAPPGGTNSLLWTRQTMAVADHAVRQATLAGGKARRQEAQVLFEPATAEKVFDAHGFIRYRVQLGA